MPIKGLFSPLFLSYSLPLSPPRFAFCEYFAVCVLPPSPLPLHNKFRRSRWPRPFDRISAKSIRIGHHRRSCLDDELLVVALVVQTSTGNPSPARPQPDATFAGPFARPHFRLLQRVPLAVHLSQAILVPLVPPAKSTLHSAAGPAVRP